MTCSHSQAVQALAFRIRLLLLLRVIVQTATVWFFGWGVFILAARFFRAGHLDWLALGLLGVVPVAIPFAARQWRRQPAFAKIRANYDRLNSCGGILMSEETADMGAWLGQLPGAVVPRFRWHGGRAWFFLLISGLFAATALLLPDRLTRFPGRRPLEIGQIVEQLRDEVHTLAQEKIVDSQKAEDLQNQLSQLQKDSSGYDPNKTWEALDHLKQSNADAAKQAAEEALTKTESLSQAETVAKAMEEAADAGMNETTASSAAQELASMLKSAKLETGILDSKIPPELLAGLDGLNKEQMEKLLQALELNKSMLGLTITNLANLRLIDAASLANCRIAGLCQNPDALAAYLSSCTNGCHGLAALAACEIPGRGGPGGGGPAAPMTWKDGTSEKDLKFQEHALPPASQLSDAQLVGVSRAAPELSGADAAAQHGALDSAAAGGGSANARVILPEQRQAVQNYFKRED